MLKTAKPGCISLRQWWSRKTSEQPSRRPQPGTAPTPSQPMSRLQPPWSPKLNLRSHSMTKNYYLSGMTITRASSSWQRTCVTRYADCWTLKPRNPYWRGRLSTVDLLIKIGFKKKKFIVSVWKVADLNWVILGGQPYWSSMHKVWIRIIFKFSVHY